MKKTLLQDCIRIAVRNNTPSKHKRYGAYHHFSFIVQDNKIVEWATNAPGKDIYSHFYSAIAMIHSECAAFKKAKGLLNRTESFQVINIRLNKKHELRISKPCRCCVEFLSTFNCDKVYFTNEDKFEVIKLNQ